MSLFDIAFSAMIAIPVLFMVVYFLKNLLIDDDEDGFNILKILPLILTSLITISIIGVIGTTLFETGLRLPIQSYTDVSPVASTETHESPVSTNADIMALINKTPDNTSRYWNNDWTMK